MTTRKAAPWTRQNPKPDAARKSLTDAQKAAAKSRADAAGRRYPNLVDNMWASQQKPAAPKKPATVRKPVAGD